MATWTWTNIASSTSYRVSNFAGDTTGQYIIAGMITGVIYSTNYGVTWNSASNISGNVIAVASSANGRTMYAVTSSTIYQSLGNYGASWTNIETTPSDSYYSGICCDSEGKNVVICSNKSLGGSGYLQYCNNPSVSGGTWTTAGTTSQSGSIDVGGGGGGQINSLTPYSANFTSVACTPTGPYYVALASDNGSSSSPESGIYRTSTPSADWTLETQSETTGQTWTSVACNQDGTKFIVCSNGNGTNSGVGKVMINNDISKPGFWTPITSTSRSYVGVAISKTGDKLYACAGSNGLYYGNTSTTSLSQDTNSISKGNVNAIYINPAGTNLGLPNVLGINGGTGTVYGLYTASYPVICFKEGTKILCLIDNKETYVPIETMTPGTLVKTCMDGYKKVELIGFSKLYNPGHTLKSVNRLYKCTPANYPELTEDLIITGHHAILAKTITEKQRADLIEITGNIFITDRSYRLIACVDDRAQPYTEEGVHTIWHFALENPEQTWNYGVYAHGLPVESCSIRTMRDLSGMTLL